MELFLNLAWVCLAAAMVGLWLWCAPRTGVDRRVQVVALALLILVLFPVISVTDDLLAAQNPAETDSCQRRDSVVAMVLAMPSLPVILPELSLVETSVAPLLGAAPDTVKVPMEKAPALSSIENRPPPTA